MFLAALAPMVAVQLTRGQVLAGLSGCVAAVPLATEIYARVPPWRPSDLPDFVVDSAATDLIVVLHGAGGPDANTRRIADALRAANAVHVVEYDWTPFVGNQLQGPYNALRVGEQLGLAIARHPGVQRVHIVGVSVGAFAADKAVSTLKALAPGVAVRETLLDPFCARGLAGLVRPASAFGVNTFGRSADEAVSVLNTDDPVPSTNLPLRHAVNFDVTAAAERERFVPLPGDTLHSWPAACAPGASDGLAPVHMPVDGSDVQGRKGRGGGRVVRVEVAAG